MASKSIAVLNSEADTNLANNLAGDISAEDVRTSIKDLADSSYNRNDDAGQLDGVNTQVGTAYTLVLSDVGKVVEMNNAATNTLTVPPNSSVAFKINSKIDIVQYGAGLTSIAAGAGVTIRSSGGLLDLGGRYSAATLYKRGPDEWVLIGDLA